MYISDEALIAYLRKHEKTKRYRLGDGSAYSFRLKSLRNPPERMPYRIVFFSCVPGAWEKDHEIPACFAVECLDKYNGGAKTPDRFIAKSGPSRSRRGAYFCELLCDVEAELRSGLAPEEIGRAHV